jgi:hypothetical protein
MDSFAVVDDFLAACYLVSLEEVLCDACLSGRLPIVLADDAKVTAWCLYSERDEDGGESATFEGLFTLMTITYHFRCHTFIDAGGERFLSDVQEFEPVDWRLRIAV